MPPEGLPHISPAVESRGAASARLQRATGSIGAPPAYRPQTAASGVARSGFGAAATGGFGAGPPVYRPGAPDTRTNNGALQRKTSVAPIPAQSPRIQLYAPPVYRPAGSAYPLKSAAQRYAGPMQVRSVQQRTALPTSLVSRSMRGRMPGTIQRAVLDKETLEKMYHDAWSNNDFDKVDQIEKLMSQLPGDSMPKTFGVSDEDACDLTYKNTQVRFTFEAGKRAQLTKAQTVLGKLMCALGASCYVAPNSEIKVDSSGKEVWTSKSGNVHKTAPPIDHYSPDWKDRLSALVKKNYDVQTFTTEGKKAYNQAPLRIIHMVCNSKRNGS
jgi:hypothetical protein